METQRDITVIQDTAVLVSTIIGVGVLALPRFVAEAGNTGAPLVTACGIVVAFLGLWIITALGRRFPNESIIQYGSHIIGTWGSRLIAVLIIVFFATLTAFGAREFGEVVNASVLQETPLQVVILVMLILAAISSRNDVTTLAHMHLFYVPFVFFPGLIVVLLSLKNAHIVFLQPILGNHFSLLPFGTGILTTAALFQGTFIQTFIIPSMKHPKYAGKASFWGIVLAGGLYLMIITATISVFGPNETKRALFPTLELAKATLLPGEVLERLDAVFLIVWVIAVFTTLLSTYYTTICSLGQLIGTKDNKMISMFVLPFLFAISIIPINVMQMYHTIEWVGHIGLIITIMYPCVLMVVARVRRIKGRYANEHPL